jgi:flagellar export protein FliJ
MPVFRFKFEAVLTKRRDEERRCRLDVARIQAERLALEERIRGHQRDIVSARGDLRTHLAGGPVDLSGVRLQAAASLGLVSKVQRAVLDLAGVHARLDAARRQLMRAAVRRRAVELLRERRFQDWLDEQRRKEQAAGDELAVMRASRPEEWT